MKANLVFWVHVLTTTFFTFSPILLDWRIIILGALLFYAQLIVFGNCVLTLIQFGKSEKEAHSFYHHFLTRLGFNFNKRKVDIFTIYIKPSLLILIALILQLVMGFRPILF